MNRSGAPAKTVFLRDQHGCELAESSGHLVQFLGISIPQRAHDQLGRLGVMVQDTGIQRIRLGQSAGSLGKVSDLAGVDRDDGQ